MEQKIIQALQDLGFTATDAKAYLGLLKNQPATGYELASRTGVPRSAIYNVVHRLESEGIINAIEKKPARYQALDPRLLFERLEAKFNKNIAPLKDAVASLDVQNDQAATWTLRGYDALIDQAGQLINNARKSLELSLWQDEALQLQPQIEAASARGVRVVLFSFTPLPKMSATCFSYDIAADELARYWSPRLIVISDHERLLVGRAQRKADIRAALSEEDVLIEMALSNLVLDITLFGQRKKQNVSEVIAGMTAHLAPIDELLQKR